MLEVAEETWKALLSVRVQEAEAVRKREEEKIEDEEEAALPLAEEVTVSVALPLLSLRTSFVLLREAARILKACLCACAEPATRA